MSELFKGKTAIISGGLGDIGRAIAIEFARHGAAIPIGDLRPAADATKLLRQLVGQNVRTLYRQLDVTDAAAVQAWVRETEAQLGVAGLIIPNAAMVTLAGIHEITPEQWSRELRVNLDGVFHLAQAATLRLIHHRLPGRVVFSGSWAAGTVQPQLSAYCASKAGLRMLCKCMALELAPHGILVNEVAPGYVDAGVSRRVWKQNPKGQKLSRKKVPVLRLISTREVAEQVVHLCHPENQHMIGSTLLMDGGLSLLS